MKRRQRGREGTLLTPGDDSAFEPDPNRDVFLVSYPRSGNTWLRTAIAILQTGEDIESIAALDRIVPPEGQRVPLDLVRQLPFYVIKSHSRMNGRTASRHYRRVVYLVRDPRDCLVSYHRYLRRRSRYGGALDKFVIDSIAGRTGPCSWQEHVLAVDDDVLRSTEPQLPP